MTAMRELTDQLDARALEVARLRARAERAEGALGRVLALCDGVEARGALLAPHQVRQAIAP